MAGFVTSVRVEGLLLHEKVTVFVRHLCVGDLVCGKGDGARLRALLLEEEPAERPTPVPPPGLVELLRQGPIDIDDVPWLVKDFAVLYRAAERLVAGDDVRPGKAAGDFEALVLQVRRLRPAFDQCESVRQRCRGGAHAR
jgi:hypothetical protein